MANTIKKEISPEPKTGFRRIAQHENFVITHDLNMVQVIRVITLDTESGKPLVEQIQNDPDISNSQKQAAFNRYADQMVTKQTDGAFVNLTGQVVEPGTNGAISQRDYFQHITLGDLEKLGLPIGPATPVTALIYALITNEIGNIDKRGDL